MACAEEFFGFEFAEIQDGAAANGEEKRAEQKEDGQ